MKTITKAKKLVQKMNRETKKANAAFEKLTPADKRVYIARDVIAQLKSGRIIATIGTWVSDPNESCVIPKKALKEDAELKSVFDKLKSCKACALGGLFVSAVRIADRLKISEMEHVKSGQCFLNEDQVDVGSNYGEDQANRTVFFNDITKYLGRFFSKQQLRLIELAFEGGQGGISVGRDPNEVAAARFFEVEDEFVDHLNLSEDDHMRLIMENIIVNKGRFAPLNPPQFMFVTPGFIG